MKKIISILLLAAILITTAGCSSAEKAPEQPIVTPGEEMAEELPMEEATKEIEAELVALLDCPAAIPSTYIPEASGTKEARNSVAVIDYSHANDGYVMVQYLANTAKKLKVQVVGPKTTYTYNLTPSKWEVFPFSDGNGTYKVVVYENVEGTKYSAKQNVSVSVALSDEFAPFIRPNQYVDYAPAVNAVLKAAELCNGKTAVLDKVSSVYDYVVKNLTYDYDLAATVKSGYLPVLDTVLSKKKGICFDYAALMTGMLRSQGVPCKLVVGYAGTCYHAWVSVYSEATGWIDGAIYFDGKNWQRMDPTFISSSKGSAAIQKYVGDGNNYTVKYIY